MSTSSSISPMWIQIECSCLPALRRKDKIAGGRRLLVDSGAMPYSATSLP